MEELEPLIAEWCLPSQAQPLNVPVRTRHQQKLGSGFTLKQLEFLQCLC